MKCLYVSRQQAEELGRKLALYSEVQANGAYVFEGFRLEFQDKAADGIPPETLQDMSILPIPKTVTIY